MKTIALAVLAAAVGGGSPAAAAVVPSVKTGKIAALGTVLVSASGRTLYHYTDESRGKVDCTGPCAQLWPPLLAKGGAKPVAGPGIVAAKLGVVKRADGTAQVTYGGFGLYLYAGDTKPGQAKGEGLEGSWYAVSPAAKIVKPAAAAGAVRGGSGSTSAAGAAGSYGTGY
jgi:predicted lipoprotein with Yx(FWY)xxD motif